MTLTGSWPTCSTAPRWATERTPGRDTFGPQVGRVAARLRTPLRPWQQDVADVALEHAGGQLFYRNVVVSIMRQQGKTILDLSVMIWRMLARPGTRVAYTAQTRLAAREKLTEDLWPIIASSPLGEWFTLDRGAGRECLRCRNGSRMVLLSTDESAGHGPTLDMAAIDEGWAAPDDRYEAAVRPAMVTKRNAQVWLSSTAGTVRSTWWHAKMDAAALCAATMREGTAGFDWGAPDDADPTDPAVWAACMPAFGTAVDESTLAADLSGGMPLAEFRRAYLNQRPHVAQEGWAVIGRDLWEAARL
jgi:phage terminase large subunit-like protein